MLRGRDAPSGGSRSGEKMALEGSRKLRPGIAFEQEGDQSET